MITLLIVFDMLRLMNCPNSKHRLSYKPPSKNKLFLDLKTDNVVPITLQLSFSVI